MARSLTYFVCFEDFEDEARRKLDRNAWNYYSTGAVREYTLRDNVEAFNRYVIFPRVLRDVSSVDLSVTVLGNKVSFPVCVSPTAFHCMAHHDGEKATARACQRMGTCMTLSSWSTTSLEEVSKATNGDGLKWLQLYICNDLELTKQLVKRAEAAGYKALVLTVDTPEIGSRLANKKNNFSLPSHLSMGHFTSETAQSFFKTGSVDLEQYVKTLINPRVTWESVDWLRSITSLPIVLKGILRPDDAREALKHDIQGILVSNHGGRQLDSVPATIDALPGIVKEVRERVEVYVDGGIRHGTDVLKALALGAKAVFVGRPVLYGLACNGEEGVYQLLSILKEEVRQAFTLSGCCNVSDVQSTRDLVVHRSKCTHTKSRL